MSATLEDITEQGLKLSHYERLALAKRLLREDDHEELSTIEAAWEEEIVARIQAIDSGKAVGIPYEQVRSEIDERMRIGFLEDVPSGTKCL